MSAAPVLTTAQIDAELADLAASVDSMSASLLELDSHPGHQLLRSYPQTGTTAAAWEQVRGVMTTLWDDFGRYRAVVDEARTVRARRSRPNEEDLAELTRLLRGESVQPAVPQVPLERRSLTAGRIGHRLTLAAMADRMDAEFTTARDLVTEVDRVSGMVREALAPLQQQWTAESDRTDSADDPQAAQALVAVGERMMSLTARSLSDPLSLGDPRAEIDSIGTELAALLTRQQRLAELQSHWPGRLEDLRELAAQVADLQLRARKARDTVAGTIRTAPLPAGADRLPALNSAIAALQQLSGDWPLRATRIAEVEAGAQAAIADVTAELELATGLLDRRTELRGRLSAYHSKAKRLGLDEDPRVAAGYQQALATLSAQPCDLAKATKDVAGYQALVNERPGRTA